MTLGSVAHTDRTIEATTNGELTLVEREDCLHITPMHRSSSNAVGGKELPRWSRSPPDVGRWRAARSVRVTIGSKRTAIRGRHLGGSTS
jgi:hypothetical protein